MTDNTNEKKERPMFRVCFSTFRGKDNRGNDIVGSPREIGCVWARKNGKPGGIQDFDHIPVELTQRQGVVFLFPVEDSDNEENNGGSL